jgi:glutamine amidotransferase
MITVVDSGGANLSSVLFALERLGVKTRLSRDPDEIRKSPKVLLPGVGAAAAAMDTLRERELVECLRGLKQPVLGICLGMQILFERSEEGDADCLGVIPGRVGRLAAQPGLPIPHMGWNRVRSVSGGCALLDEGEEFFYFVHSFAAPLCPAVKGVADYGVEVPAVVERGNWFGAQFHPERSGAPGHRFLERFARL